MKLYIETENNLPKNHPALEENLLQAFGNIPEHWVPFERIERPKLGVYDVFDQEEPEYQIVDGIYKDVWMVRPMDEAEKTAKQQEIKDAWVLLPNRENFATWVFDEVTCSYISPVPRPDDGKLYRWDGAVNNWIEVAPPAII
jgi:hypothetical protein